MFVQGKESGEVHPQYVTVETASGSDTYSNKLNKLLLAYNNLTSDEQKQTVVIFGGYIYTKNNSSHAYYEGASLDASHLYSRQFDLENKVMYESINGGTPTSYTTQTTTSTFILQKIVLK